MNNEEYERKAREIVELAEGMSCDQWGRIVRAVERGISDEQRKIVISTTARHHLDSFLHLDIRNLD